MRSGSTSFDFATAGRVVVGAGRSAELGGLIAGLGSRALVCTGSHPERHRPILDRLDLPTAIVRVTGEPTVEDARAAVAAGRDHQADLVVGIGGGSVLDVAKAVAMLLGNGGDPLDYLEVVGRGLPITRASVPYAAVPTTAGTGAEVTENAVLASPQHNRKASLRSRYMLPRLALVDPSLAIACPPEVTAASGLDALTQCLEPYVSARATALTDVLAAEGLRRAAFGLRAAYLDGGDLDARTNMAICSLLSGMSLANAKLGAVHGLAGVIGGMVEAAHGAICAALLAATVEVNVRALRTREPENPALSRFDHVASILTGKPDAGVQDGLAWIRETVQLLRVPGLAELGLRLDHLPDIVAGGRASSSMAGNPITLTDVELHAILETSM